MDYKLLFPQEQLKEEMKKELIEELESKMNLLKVKLEEDLEKEISKKAEVLQAELLQKAGTEHLKEQNQKKQSSLQPKEGRNRSDDEESDSVPVADGSSTRGLLQKVIRNSYLVKSFEKVFKEDKNIPKPPVTLHMYAIATIADARLSKKEDDTTESQKIQSRKIEKSILFSFCSFLLVSLQILAFLFIVFEANKETCALHTDCRIGSYCYSADLEDSQFLWRQPRCMECTFFYEYNDYDNLTEQCDNFIRTNTDWYEKDLDQTMLWFSKDFKANLDRSQVSNLTSPITDESIIQCLGLKHCQDTKLVGEDKALNELGYLALNANRLSVDQIFLFAFIAIMFWCNLSRDLLEATMEDATLETIKEARIYFETNSEGIVSGADKGFYHLQRVLSFLIIRNALRLRQLVIPTMAGASTVSILIMDTLSGKNILLNFLALEFLLQVDNLFAEAFLSKDQLDFVQDTLFGDKSLFKEVYHESDIKVEHIMSHHLSLIWPKFSGFVLTFLVVIFITNITELMMWTQISSVGWIIWLFIQITVGIAILFDAIEKSMPWARKDFWKRFHSFVLALFRGFITLLFFSVLVCITYAIVASKEFWQPKAVIILSLGPVIIPAFYFEIYLDNLKPQDSETIMKKQLIFCCILSMALFVGYEYLTFWWSFELGRDWKLYK